MQRLVGDGARAQARCVRAVRKMTSRRVGKRHGDSAKRGARATKHGVA